MNRLKYLFCVAALALATTAITPISAQGQNAAFPVTIEHKFGSTTIEKAPERIVVIGYSEQDAYFALGVKPVAIRYWYGDAPYSIFPWAVEAADGATPEVLNMQFGNLNYEAILALKPDVIAGTISGITQEEYEKLSQIAPTVAQSAEYIDFGVPWQEVTRIAGAITGKNDEAKALISEVEGLFAKAREENPHFQGKTIAVAYQFDKQYGFYTAQDQRGRFFTELGFVVPQSLLDVAGESFYANLSAERVDLLDQDLLVFVALSFSEIGREGIEQDPLITRLNAVREGRVAFIPAEYDDALQFSSVLSLRYALEGILPVLQAALPNPSSTPTPSQ
ncbi:MAG: iron-siderophore ABC transporter substrate-binding protein [Anaerolineae bacterium]